MLRKDQKISWNIEKPLPSTSQFTLVIHEHRAFRKVNVLSVNVAVKDLLMKPVHVIDEPNGESLLIYICCKVAGPFSDLVSNLVYESQSRPSGMQALFKAFKDVCEVLNRIVNITGAHQAIHSSANAAVSAATTLFNACKKHEKCEEAARVMMTDVASVMCTDIPSYQLESDLVVESTKALLSAFGGFINLIAECSSSAVLGGFICGRGKEINERKEMLKSTKEVFDWNVKIELWKTAFRIETESEETLLAFLRPVPPAFYEPEKACLGGSRRDTLRTIGVWMESDSKQLLLHGEEGCGKSAIVHTVAQSLDGRNQLAGCFFCAEDSERRSLDRIIPTIAYQLAEWHADYRSVILDLLQKRNERNLLQNLRLQFEILLKESLSKLSERGQSPPPSQPLVFVLDSLGGCEDWTSKGLLFVSYMKYISNAVPWLKVFVSTRELPKDDVFLGSNSRHLDISDPLVDLQGDIRTVMTYLSNAEIHPTAQYYNLESKAISLFSRTLIALRRSDTWIGHQLSGTGNTAPGESWMDTVFRAAVFGTTFINGCKENSVPESREILAVAYCLGAIEPPTKEQLLHFLRPLLPRMTDADLRGCISLLHPVLSQDGALTRVLFPPRDFLDFLADRTRSCCFSVDLRPMNYTLAGRCLNTMHAQLKFNICGLRSSCMESEADPAFKQATKTLVSEALRYSSLCWLDLVIRSCYDNDDNDLRGSIISILCFPKALFWIEVLCLIGHLDRGKKLLSECTETFENEDRILRLALELLGFITNFETAITISIPHIYISALLWLPRDSSIFTESCYRLSHRPSLTFETLERIDGLDGGIDRYRNSVSLAISPDRRRLVSGSSAGMLRIWDGSSGRAIGTPIKAHRDWVRAVAYSSDGTRLASGSFDGTVNIWDAESGELLTGPLPSSDCGATFSVAFSPDSSRIVSGHEDGSLSIWNTQYSSIFAESQGGHAGLVYTVAYSPDGRRIVSGSGDATLRVWDATTGTPVLSPFRGHKDSIRAVTYSPDGRRIISGSSDTTIRVWDSQTGDAVDEPLTGHTKGITDVAYSTDGRRILSASEDGTIRFWDPADVSLLGTICQGESRWDPLRHRFLCIPSWWPRDKLKVGSLLYSANPTVIPKDGWIRTLNGGLLLWVPKEHRDCSCHVATKSTVTRYDDDEMLKNSCWKDLPHGTDWARIMDLEE